MFKGVPTRRWRGRLDQVEFTPYDFTGSTMEYERIAHGESSDVVREQREERSASERLRHPFFIGQYATKMGLRNRLAYGSLPGT